MIYATGGHEDERAWEFEINGQTYLVGLVDGAPHPFTFSVGSTDTNISLINGHEWEFLVFEGSAAYVGYRSPEGDEEELSWEPDDADVQAAIPGFDGLVEADLHEEKVREVMEWVLDLMADFDFEVGGWAR